MTAEALKPCPFCGSPAIMISFINGNYFLVYRPECSSCSCQLGASTDEESAIEIWNTRA